MGKDYYNLPQLTKRLAVLMHQNIDLRLRPYDLARSQYVVLHYLTAQPDISTGDLAEIMQVEPATLSGIADTLQAKGLVIRIDHASDKRRKSLQLTRKGSKLFAKIPPPGPAMERILLDGISPPEAAAFRDATMIMLENLQTELKRQEGGTDVTKD